MDRKEEARAAALGAADSLGSSGELPRSHRSSARPESKYRRTLREALARSDSDDERLWLHRFLAERACRDHCLPSTISQLEKKGLSFERRDVEVLGFQGVPT